MDCGRVGRRGDFRASATVEVGVEPADGARGSRRRAKARASYILYMVCAVYLACAAVYIVACVLYRK